MKLTLLEKTIAAAALRAYAEQCNAVGHEFVQRDLPQSASQEFQHGREAAALLNRLRDEIRAEEQRRANSVVRFVPLRKCN